MEITLVLSILILLAAPLLARLAGLVPAIRGGFDGFVLIVVLGLISITLIPEALAHGGIYALGLVILGFTLPSIAELIFHRTEEMTHRIILVIASFALILHAASDGAILAFADGRSDGYFVAAGILLHRFGVAISVWWLLRPVLSSTGGFVVLGGLGAMTLVGYFLAVFAGDFYEIPLAGYWQAFAAGSLLHVVLHPITQEDITHSHPETSLSQRLGTALGVCFIAGLVGAHYLHHTPGPLGHLDPHHHGYHAIDALLSVGRLMAPILLLMLTVGAALARARGASWRDAVKGIEDWAPWSLLFLIAGTVIMVLAPDMLPVPENGALCIRAVGHHCWRCAYSYGGQGLFLTTHPPVVASSFALALKAAHKRSGDVLLA